MPPTTSLLKHTLSPYQLPGLGQAEVRSLEACAWQGPKALSHHLLPPRACLSRSLWLGTEPGLKSRHCDRRLGCLKMASQLLCEMSAFNSNHDKPKCCVLYWIDFKHSYKKSKTSLFWRSTFTCPLKYLLIDLFIYQSKLQREKGRPATESQVE